MSKIDKITVESGCELGYHIHFDNGWYGENKFFYIKTDISSKTQAGKKYKSMVMKYIKKYKLPNDKHSLGKYECLKKGNQQTTYIHSVGPCYHLDRYLIQMDKLERFILIETARLKHNRENSYDRMDFDEFSYQKNF